MFNKKRTSLVLRFVLILVLFGSVFGIPPLSINNNIAHAIGNTPGTLDTTFDSDGLVTTALGSYDDEARAIAVQSNGKIVGAGRFSNPGYDDFFVVRYNENGSLDTSFDVDGIVTTDFGGDDVAVAVAIQTDGKIVAAGYTSPDGSTADLALARYNTDGSLDTGFDSDGKLIASPWSSPWSGYNFPTGIAIQTDDKIILVGSKYVGINDNDIALVRYNSNGSLDTTFDIDGIVTTAIGSGTGDYGAAVAIQSDGKIIVGGSTFNAVTKTDFALVRYNSTGSLDISFDTDGIVTKDFGIGLGSDYAHAIAIQADGKILITGEQDNYFLLARYNNNGSPDTSFDTDGFVATDFINSSYADAQQVKLQSNGKIIVAGQTRFGYGSTSYDFAMVRYNANGSLDTGFDTDGIVITDFGGNLDDIEYAVAIQADGKIVLAGSHYVGGSSGSTNWDVAVARYIGDAVSKIYYVKSNAGGLNNGSSWTNAYTSLQSALSAASSGDEIWVAAGTYKPTTGADRTIAFTLKNGVAIYGGFAGTETLHTQRNPATNVTTLSGEIGAAGTADNSYHVVVGGGTNNTAVLDGFTVAAGNANGSAPNDAGGGMYNIDGNPSLANLIFSANSALSGGGMFNYNSSPGLTNVIFNGNSAEDGGGMGNYTSSPSLTNVSFIANVANTSGGGMFNYTASSPSLMNVLFSGNSVGSVGGGMVNILNSSPSLTNVTFYNNSAVELGGAIGYTGNSGGSPTLINVTLNANTASIGGGIYNGNNNLTIKNGILWGNANGDLVNFNSSIPVVTYSIVQGGYAGTGNLNSDPLLGALANNGGFTQTMALGIGSPAINAGTNMGCPATDQRGVARPQGGQCDIGAYEYVATFADVPFSYWANGFIEGLSNAGVTGGCGNGNYCPENVVTRAQMAVFLLRGMYGPSYTPPAVGASTGFTDVPADHWAAAWIKQLSAEGITGGCGTGVYCPDITVTRAQMAIFLLRAEHGSVYTPPAATGVFTDVPVGHWADKWIEQLAVEGITGGCGVGGYCPETAVTRAQMAVFLVKTFNLP